MSVCGHQFLVGEEAVRVEWGCVRCDGGKGRDAILVSA